MRITATITRNTPIMRSHTSDDIDHHTGIDAVASGLPIIDAGHYGTEYIFMKAMRKILEEKYPSLQITCAKMKSPYMIL